MAALIGNKRQRSRSGEAETGMEIEDEDDEGASDSGSVWRCPPPTHAPPGAPKAKD
jgi:hypothetical protein